MKKITTAVFPVAGLGSRFLPVTKAQPKEMLPIVDKPIIQYVVEEAISAGITQLIFITSSSKRAIEDYFDRNVELESALEAAGKYKALQKVRDILPLHVNCVYIRQSSPRGLGDAVLCARRVVGEQPFAVLLADDIIDCGEKGCLQSMLEIYEKTGGSVLATEEVPLAQTSQYGIISPSSSKEDYLEIDSIIEKPDPQNAPSTLAVTGRYILTPDIFPLLADTKQGIGGEIQLTDAIAALLKTQKVYAYPFKGRRYDCGNHSGFIEATIHYSLKNPELCDRIVKLLEQFADGRL